MTVHFTFLSVIFACDMSEPPYLSRSSEFAGFLYLSKCEYNSWIQ